MSYTQKNNKSSVGKKVLSWVLAIAIIAGVVGLVVFNRAVDSGSIDRSIVAMESANFSVSIAEMEYFYRNVATSYISMLNSYGVSNSISSTTSHKNQQSMFSDGTWFEFFLDQSVTQVKEILLCCEAAKAEGLALDDEDQKTIEDEIKNMEATAASYKLSFNDYIRNYFGAGVNEEAIRNVLELQVLSNKYIQKHVDAADISADTLNKTYTDNVESYDVVNYLTYTFDYNALYLDEEEKKEAEEAAKTDTSKNDKDPAESTSADTTADPTESDAESVDPAESTADTTVDTTATTTTATTTEEPAKDPFTTEDKAEAEKLAKEYADKLDAILKASTPENIEENFYAFMKTYFMDVLGYTESKFEESKANFSSGNVKYSKSNDVAVWAFDDERAVGDYKLFTETESHKHKEGDDHSKLGNVYKFVILTKTEGPDKTLVTADVRHVLFSKSEYKDAAKVEEIYNKWVADGAKAEDLDAIAAEYSADTSNKDKGGLMEDLVKGETVTEFNDWVFAEGRKAGDHGIVKTADYGWHIVYYVEDGYEGWEKTIVDEIQNKAQTDAKEAAAAAYTVTQNDAKMNKFIDA